MSDRNQRGAIDAGSSSIAAGGAEPGALHGGAVMLVCAVGWLALSAIPAGAAITYSGVDLYPASAAGQPPASLQVAAAGQLVGFTPAVVYTSAGTLITLPTDPTFTQSFALATDGTFQVGFAQRGNDQHAFLWNGSSGTDLNPIGFTNTQAFGVGGGQQVGRTYPFGFPEDARAMLWKGDPVDGRVDLGLGTAYATDGIHQVGESGGRATLWDGNPGSGIDLGPGIAYGVDGAQQVGDSGGHAMLWNGIPGGGIDLHPLGFSQSRALATNGSTQVGWGTAGGPPKALLWNGTTTGNFATDLSTRLPPGFFVSNASTIDAAGNVFGFAVSGSVHAVAWYPVFERFTSPPQSVTGGPAQSADVPNPAPGGGGVHVTFPLATAGDFSSTYTVETALGLKSRTGNFSFNPVESLTGAVQDWDLSFTGTFTGGALVTFNYDPALLPPGFDETALHVFHFVNGGWEDLLGVVNATDNTITFTTDSFSPFTLGTVPEPAGLSMFAFACMGLLRRGAHAPAH